MQPGFTCSVAEMVEFSTMRQKSKSNQVNMLTKEFWKTTKERIKNTHREMYANLRKKSRRYLQNCHDEGKKNKMKDIE